MRPIAKRMRACFLSNALDPDQLLEALDEFALACIKLPVKIHLFLLFLLLMKCVSKHVYHTMPRLFFQSYLRDWHSRNGDFAPVSSLNSLRDRKIKVSIRIRLRRNGIMPPFALISAKTVRTHHFAKQPAVCLLQRG